MNLIALLRFPRLKELTGALCFLAALAAGLSLASYHPGDASWNTATGLLRAKNACGRLGAVFADSAFQLFGLGGWLFPPLFAVAGWRWLRNRSFETPAIRLSGFFLLSTGVATALSLWLPWKVYSGAFERGGVAGYLFASLLTDYLNIAGASLFLIGLMIIAVYLVSSFSLAHLTDVAEIRWREHRESRRAAAAMAPLPPLESRAEAASGTLTVERQRGRAAAAAAGTGSLPSLAGAVAAEQARLLLNGHDNIHPPGNPPYPETALPAPPDLLPWEPDIPIHSIEDEAAPASRPVPEKKRKSDLVRAHYHLPATALLNEPSEKTAYDSEELKDIAGRIKQKLEEFNVLGNVVQINPGPVVTTFEFKPDAGVKIAKITTLAEDLALGLQADSVLIERIPGKPTVAIEMPNTRRETISLRQVLESAEFQESASLLTVALGKDISGRMRLTELEKMPHLLIAGTTGSGKSVMLNALILSFLYKATPDEVRFIMVDPKRVELGIYEGIPHLLTPVIADAKKATNALRNAVFEMERRLKLLASHGLRNIDQFNRKMRQLQARPLSLFAAAGEPDANPDDRPLPYIVIVIDELADLMLLERAGVEESIIRLAQMARAVGIHLVLATQRPSVDVITGLIKANLPARISFKLRTRIDSRTVLDVMGAEHLLGMGDMLFLPPGTSRLIRVHGPFVTEAEINRVVGHWKDQATPEYDQSFLMAPQDEDSGEPGDDEFAGEADPLYAEAVRVVIDMGKASTSVLQRRLKLGYGRAARILDRMEKDGIIGPPDGPRPREVLRRPDWLDEVETVLR
jgi:S-DNA-T family DNA segregation ATPase FtsK/SpoIIIE